MSPIGGVHQLDIVRSGQFSLSSHLNCSVYPAGSLQMVGSTWTIHPSEDLPAKSIPSELMTDGDVAAGFRDGGVQSSHGGKG